MLIRLHGCASWSAPLLFAYGIRHVFAWPGPYRIMILHIHTDRSVWAKSVDPDQTASSNQSLHCLPFHLHHSNSKDINPNFCSSESIEPRHKKTCFRGMRPRMTQQACSATEARLQSWNFACNKYRYIILCRKRTIKSLIRLRRCAGWSVALLLAYGRNRFSHDVAHLVLLLAWSYVSLCGRQSQSDGLFKH